MFNAGVDEPEDNVAHVVPSSIEYSIELLFAVSVQVNVVDGSNTSNVKYFVSSLLFVVQPLGMPEVPVVHVAFASLTNVPVAATFCTQLESEFCPNDVAKHLI